MDSRVKITDGGDVYMYVPTECVEILKGYQYNLVWFPKDKPVSIDEYDELMDVQDEEVFAFVGSITDFHVERLGMFPTLESVRAYMDMHGKAPWGISAVARRNGWKRISVKGVSLTLQDRDGRRLNFYRRGGRTEME